MAFMLLYERQHCPTRLSAHLRMFVITRSACTSWLSTAGGSRPRRYSRSRSSWLKASPLLYCGQAYGGHVEGGRMGGGSRTQQLAPFGISTRSQPSFDGA